MPLQDKDCAVTYNALLVGESAVGKTALLDRLMGREFQVAGRPTCGVDFVKKIFEIDGAIIQLIIWDSAGWERLRSITRLQYRNIQGIILVYDVTNLETFTSLPMWIRSIYDETCHKHCEYEPIPIILCGNKTDLDCRKRVQADMGTELARKEMAFEFLEASAKSGYNVHRLFQRLAFHITDICNPEIMRSYHPFMMKQNTENAGKKNHSKSVMQQRLIPDDVEEKQKKNVKRKFILSGCFCCASQNT